MGGVRDVMAVMLIAVEVWVGLGGEKGVEGMGELRVSGSFGFAQDDSVFARDDRGFRSGWQGFRSGCQGVSPGMTGGFARDDRVWVGRVSE